MKKKITIYTLLGVFLFLTGCAKKRCVGPGSHDGLINALTCDYKQNIEELQSTLDKKSLNRIKLLHEFQRLIAIKTGKTDKLEQLKAEITQIESDLNPTKEIISKMDDIKYKANPLDIIKLKQRLSSLNMSILNKSTFFSVADASFTNKKLLDYRDKQKYAQAYDKDSSTGVKYAKAYDKDSSSGVKYAQAYTKDSSLGLKYAKAYNKDSSSGVNFAQAYQQDIDNDKKVRLSLSKKIKNLSNSIDSSNIKNSSSALTALMSDIENYKNSLKKS